MGLFEVGIFGSSPGVGPTAASVSIEVRVNVVPSFGYHTPTPTVLTLPFTSDGIVKETENFPPLTFGFASCLSSAHHGSSDISQP